MVEFIGGGVCVVVGLIIFAPVIFLILWFASGGGIGYG